MYSLSWPDQKAPNYPTNNVFKVAEHFTLCFYHKEGKGTITIPKPFNDSFSMQFTHRAHCCTANCMRPAEGNSSVYRTVMGFRIRWRGNHTAVLSCTSYVTGTHSLAFLSLICLICKMVQYQPCRVIMNLDKMYSMYQISSQVLYK